MKAGSRRRLSSVRERWCRVAFRRSKSRRVCIDLLVHHDAGDDLLAVAWHDARFGGVQSEAFFGGDDRDGVEQNPFDMGIAGKRHVVSIA